LKERITLTYKIIDTPTVLKTFDLILRERGTTSCPEVAGVLNQLGYRSKKGGALSRQTVIFHMKKTEEGRELLKQGRKHGGALERCSLCGQWLGKNEHECK